jgi:hypothetical protein
MKLATLESAEGKEVAGDIANLMAFLENHQSLRW